MKGSVESCRRRSRCDGPVVVLVQLAVEVRSPIEVEDDGVSFVNKTSDQGVVLPVPEEVEWKIGIQVARGLGEGVEVLDALEEFQKKVNLAGTATKSAVKNVSE